MKIGLLSMQRVHNYGSFWQAYCLKKMIEEIGNSVEFIDIIAGENNSRVEYKRTFSLKKLKRIPYYVFQRKKGEIFYKFQKNVLGCTEEKNYSTDYDGIFIGSDEVFNFVQESPWGFTTQLFGDMSNDNINTYAACFGRTTLEDIIERGYSDKIYNAMMKISRISVRDQNSSDIVEKILGKEPQIHLDPVMIGELPIKNEKAGKNEKYILIYSYDFRFSDRELIDEIKVIAKKLECKIISVGFYQDWCDENIVPDPYQLLSYFNNAEYIITDTFHGTIFSVRCHKKFVTVIRDSNRKKLEDLLNRINLKERIIKNRNDLERIIDEEIDYVSFEKLREKEQVRSFEYLRTCMIGEKERMLCNEKNI